MPARLDKKPNCRTMEEELYISTKSIVMIILFSILFLIMAFIIKGPTYGIL